MDVTQRDRLRVRALRDGFTAARQLRGRDATEALTRLHQSADDLRLEQHLRQEPRWAQWL